MKNFLRGLAMAFYVFVSMKSTAQNSINFLQNDLETAQKQAEIDQKIVLLKFSAKYCLSCRIMDEYVWTDAELVALVSEKCVAVAIDIQNFDGMTLKDLFSVQTLPTILLLDANGNTMFRIETSCSARQLLQEIAFYSDKKNLISTTNFDDNWMPAEAFLIEKMMKNAPKIIIPTTYATENGSETPAFAMNEIGWPMH